MKKETNFNLEELLKQRDVLETKLQETISEHQITEAEFLQTSNDKESVRKALQHILTEFNSVQNPSEQLIAEKSKLIAKLSVLKALETLYLQTLYNYERIESHLRQEIHTIDIQIDNLS